MNILMLTSTLPRFAGDMQANFVGEQAEAWLAARPNAAITILAPHDAGIARKEELGRLTIERFRYALPEGLQKLAYPAILPNILRNPLLALLVPFFIIFQAFAAKKLLRQNDYDLIYAHWVMPQGLVAAWLSRKSGVPYILQTHSSDLTVFDKFGSLGRKKLSGLLRGALRFFAVNSDQLGIAKSFLEEAEHAAFESKSCVLPMGVAQLQSADEQGKGAQIGTIGRLSRKKGLDLLIAAAEQLASEGVLPKIAIAGDGEDAADLRALVGNSDVNFPGFLSGDNKEAFLASCERFAFPARAIDGDVEGMPVALLEALMRGQPVLASRDTNIELLPEWPDIQNDVVFVANPADIDGLAEGLRQLLERAPGSAKGAARVLERYLWENLIEEYLKPIEQSLSSRV
ncbi:MAG: glycosyltransferase [Erythrobacter sp.]